MGGPEMTPQTPQRSQRPGKPGALLDDAAARYPSKTRPARYPRRRDIDPEARSAGKPGALLEDAAAGSPRRRDIRTLGAPRGTGALLESRTILRRAARD